MNRSRLPRPSPLDTRADSPMREELHLANGSPVNGNAPHGLPTPANDVPSSGFTAVNGESQRSTSFRPDDAAPRTSVTMANGDRGSLPASAHGPPPGAYLAHNWRPDERHSQPDSQRPPYETPLSHKRKRDESSVEGRDEVRDGQAYVSGNESPKRRMAVLNSGGIPSPGGPYPVRSSSSNDQALPPISADTYHR